MWTAACRHGRRFNSSPDLQGTPSEGLTVPDAVHVERRGTTTVVTIDRPERRNAVDGPTARALHAAFLDFDGDDDQLVAVLTGAGGAFCAGADLKSVATGDGNRIDVMGADPDPTALGPMGPTRLRLAKPVIAAIEGHAVAGGLELALWCDLRVAARDAIFGVYCRRWGVPLVDGGTVRLPRLIGQSRAMDMILSGRPVVGTDAEQWGLANRVTEPGKALAGALELAEQLAAFPQRCLRSDRASALDQWSLPEWAALAHETELGIQTVRSGETQQGAARFAAGEGRHGAF
jgi:enoyl-CoA hydratase